MANTIDIALRIATQAHAGQTARAGEPFILHPLTVGLMGRTDAEKIAGFLHDVVEDSDFTFDDLLAAGIPVDIVSALRLLTHEKSEPYFDYVQRIIDSGNPIALHVKHHDLQHNYARGKAYPELQAKHGRALEMVQAAVDGCSHVELYRTPKGDAAHNLGVAIFAGGCFWGVQHHFGKVPGVRRTLVGYTGSDAGRPSYADVRNHTLPFVEAVIVEFDTRAVSYTELCKLFFEIHDPAQTDGVGPDLGPQYRSCIFYADEQQRREAQDVADILRSKGHEVNTRFLPAGNFWIGEEYHQRYYEKTGGEPYCHRRVKKFD